jgi:hypothetical protein
MPELFDELERVLDGMAPTFAYLVIEYLNIMLEVLAPYQLLVELTLEYHLARGQSLYKYG